jgi:PIN domain nuclease of toxin-antitoxin system
MRLLLDTNVLLWWATEESRLSTSARAAIGDTANWVAVSAASIWELAIKRATGKLPSADSLAEDVAEYGLQALPVTQEHAWAAGRLPLHHRDPFDRMLVAQAQLEGLTLVTRDRKLARYQVAILPA